MTCSRCKSSRIFDVSGKCRDLFSGTYKNKEIEGYVPEDVGIGGDDYIEFSYCLACGQIQGEFPVGDPKSSDADDDDDDDDEDEEPRVIELLPDDTESVEVRLARIRHNRMMTDDAIFTKVLENVERKPTRHEDDGEVLYEWAFDGRHAVASLEGDGFIGYAYKVDDHFVAGTEQSKVDSFPRDLLEYLKG